MKHTHIKVTTSVVIDYKDLIPIRELDFEINSTQSLINALEKRVEADIYNKAKTMIAYEDVKIELVFIADDKF